MAHSFIPVPKALSLHDGNLAEQWRKFKSAFTNYELATGSNQKDVNVRVAVLLSVIGEDAVELYDTFTWEDPDDKGNFDLVIKNFESYCIPRKNILFETYRFTCRKQEESEPVDRYLTDLRKIADHCEFTDKPRRLRDQLVFGIKNDRVRERLLREPDPPLEIVIEKIRANELAAAQAKEISESTTESTYRVQKITKKAQGMRLTPQSSYTGNQNVLCKYCGREHERKKELCPAFGMTCNSCKKPNHFSTCCRSTRSNEANELQDPPEEAKMVTFNVYTLASSATTKQTKTFLVPQSGKHVTFHIDTGASCNVLPFQEYARITNDHNGKKLIATKVQLKTYGGKTYTSEGAYNLSVTTQRKNHVIKVHVVKLIGQPLLSLKTSEELGVLKILDSDQASVSEVSDTPVTGMSKQELISKYKHVFEGLGKLRGQYKIQIDPAAQPVVHAPRKFPVSLRDDLKKHLEELEHMEVIAKVTTPTDWVSSLMVVRKPNKLRLCIDPRDLNKAIKREHYQLPCVEEVATRMNHAKVFSVLDAKQGFWQVELEEESSYLTPFGRYRWKRMPFGISPAPEIWQRKMHELIEGLQGCEVVADDFLVIGCGRTYEEAVRDHDRNIEALLKKASEANLKLNPDKLKFKMKEVAFIGHLLTQDGVKPDPSKIEAITNMPEPKNEKDLRRILGMVQYLAKFLPSLSNVTTPLRQLTHLNAEWNWTSVHRQSLKAVKGLMSKAPVLAYFDSKKEVVLQTDASEAGLGGVLLQEGRPVHFTSRAMTATEQRYAQIEKEMLAIVHACAKFDHYINGRNRVRVDTDHKPLEVIFKKPISGSPKRLQRMLLFLQKYQLDVHYKKGSELYIADTLSRANLPCTLDQKLKDCFSMEEAKVCSEVQQLSLSDHIPNSQRRIQEIREGSALDNGIQEALVYVRSGWPNERKLVTDAAKPYFQCKEELTEDDGLLFKSRRMIIPTKMRLGMMKLLHTGHIGIENTLRRAREYLYWPRMNEDLKEFISRCDICNSHRPNNAREPLQHHELPDRAWQIVSTDIFHWLGWDYVVLVDHYSNFFEYERLFQSSSAEVIKFIKKQFSRYGAAERLVSDNGPQYSSQEFKAFAKKWGFDHITSSPHYPRSNGKAESAVKVCKQIMTKAYEGKEDFFEALLDIRNTPDAITGLSPAQKCFGRRTRSLIPMKSELLLPEPLPDVKSKMDTARTLQKQHYDRGTKPLCHLQERELARIRLPGQKRWSKGRIVKELGSRSYLISVGGVTYRRNRQAIRKCNEHEAAEDPPSPQQPSVVSEERLALLPGYDPTGTEDTGEPPSPPPPRRSARIRKPTDFYKPG